jgi:hypothetical protein
MGLEMLGELRVESLRRDEVVQHGAEDLTRSRAVEFEILETSRSDHRLQSTAHLELRDNASNGETSQKGT